MAIWSGSIWVGIAAHAANNLTAMLLFYALGGRSDDDVPSLLQLAGLLATGAAVTAPFLVLPAKLDAWRPVAPSTRARAPPPQLHRARPRTLAGGDEHHASAMLIADSTTAASASTSSTPPRPYRQGFAEVAKHTPELDAHLHARCTRRPSRET